MIEKKRRGHDLFLTEIDAIHVRLRAVPTNAMDKINYNFCN